MEDRNSCTGSRERLGLSFTIDYLLFNKGVKGSKEELAGSHTTEQRANTLDHRKPKLEEVEIRSETHESQRQSSEVQTGERKFKDEEGDDRQREEGEEEVTTTTTMSASHNSDKPNQSYIALISKAILASEEKKLLLCDIYQWIMDHYPYFKSKVCSPVCVLLFTG